MKYQKGFINERDFVHFMIAMVLIGIVFGSVLFLVIQALWELIKPLIHAATY